MSSLQRIAVVMLAIGLVVGAWRPCAGGGATPEARMSCCLRHAGCAKHKVAEGASAPRLDQAAADACCAASERRDASQPTVAIVAAPLLVRAAGLFAALPAVATPGVAWRRPPPLLASRQTPTHLLLSVFLI